MLKSSSVKSPVGRPLVVKTPLPAPSVVKAPVAKSPVAKSPMDKLPVDKSTTKPSDTSCLPSTNKISAENLASKASPTTLDKTNVPAADPSDSPSSSTVEQSSNVPVKEAAKAIEEKVKIEVEENHSAKPGSNTKSDNAPVETLENNLDENEKLSDVSDDQNPSVEQTASTEQPTSQLENGIAFNPLEQADTRKVLLSWVATSAKKVQLCGSFNDWEQKVDLVQVDGKHELCIPLPPGKHAYKFIVDGEWLYDFTSPNETDSNGNVNNVIVV